MANIILKNVNKAFGKDVVIPNLNLEIPDGSFTVLVGPSGCGKTTTLRMIAGLEAPTSGEVYIGDREVTKIAPGKRGVAMVFQNYALYPMMTVKENIEFGLKNKKVPKEEREKTIAEISEIVGLTPYLDRKPSTLSGGQRQRVALARAIVKKPDVFLMDEPLSNLDAKLRAQMRVELIQLQKRLGVTFVYVTHDQIEAMSMGDNIVLMSQGVIMQQSKPRVIYRDPQNIFTAQFIGTPPMNILDVYGQKGYKLGFRPEKAMLSYKGTDNRFRLNVQILTKEVLGSEIIYQVSTQYGPVMVKSYEGEIEDNASAVLSVNEEDLYFFDEKGERVHKGDGKYEECIKFGRES